MAYVRVAAVGDLHCTKTSQGAFQPLFTAIRDVADLLLIAGDLTDYGLPEEAQVLTRELSIVRVPVIAVLGNHDRESGKEAEVRHVLSDAGMTVLDGDAAEVNGVGIAGITGFGGGFGKHALAPWGEPVIKQFVHAAVEEALKLEKALSRLRTPSLIALMHYSPVQRTVDGEPLEIYPFLGSSRLEEPLGRYPVSLVLHGHAHRGRPEGTTSSGAAVYNVSLPLLTRVFPDRPPFRVFNVEAAEHPKREGPPTDTVPAASSSRLPGPSPVDTRVRH